jgi:hypothetical protein
MSLEVVLQGVPEGMWSQDERVLEQCVGGPAELQTLIQSSCSGGKL